MIDLTTNDKQFLEKAYFPVSLQPTKYYNGIDWKISDNFKAVVNDNTGVQLNNVTNRYKIIENEQLVNNMLELLDKTDQKCYIDYSHSFINDKRMRLQFTFPELFLTDIEQDKNGYNTPLSLFIHNSYDSSEGIRGMWGAIRGICSNGMIFGTVKGNIYAKHTEHANIEILNFVYSFENAIRKLPDIQSRINLLEEETFIQKDIEFINNKFPQKFAKDMGVDLKKERSRWELINLLTFWISHYVNQQRRYTYQQMVSKQFGL